MEARIVGFRTYRIMRNECETLSFGAFMPLGGADVSSLRVSQASIELDRGTQKYRSHVERQVLMKLDKRTYTLNPNP